MSKLNSRSLGVSPAVQKVYDNQYHDGMREMRMLAARFKARNVMEVCAGQKYRRVLEVGCGDGSLLKWLDTWGFGEELYGAEISISALAQVKKAGIQRLKKTVRFDGYRLPFANKSFDLVIFSHVLEHVEFPRLILRELARVGKQLAVEIPCEYSPKMDEKVEQFLDYGHLFVFLPNQLRFLLKTEGFSIRRDKLSEPSYEVEIAERKSGPNWRPWSGWIARARDLKRRIVFRLVPERKRQFLGSAYTVLCVPGRKGLRIRGGGT